VAFVVVADVGFDVVVVADVGFDVVVVDAALDVVVAVAFWERIALGAVESTDEMGFVDIRQDFGLLERLSLY